MATTIKSREYHRAYQKWDKLLLEGKTKELIVIGGNGSGATFTVTLKQNPPANNAKILSAVEALPDQLAPLQTIRKDYDSGFRV